MVCGGCGRELRVEDEGGCPACGLSRARYVVFPAPERVRAEQEAREDYAVREAQ